MLYALSDQNEKISAIPKGRAICPLCSGAVIAKCGDIKIWHWAHESGLDCDSWHEPETSWHLYWKSLFPPENVEVTMKRDGQWHRADIFSNGVVVELQHSPISADTILAREEFYNKMIWVFDVTDAYYAFRFTIPGQRVIKDFNTIQFRWKHAKRTLAFVEAPLFIDIDSWGYLWRMDDFDTNKKPCKGMVTAIPIRKWCRRLGVEFIYYDRVGFVERHKAKYKEERRVIDRYD